MFNLLPKLLFLLCNISGVTGFFQLDLFHFLLKGFYGDRFIFFNFFDDVASCYLLFEHGKPENFENEFKRDSLEDPWLYVLDFFLCFDRVDSS
jgi:hypothetical protein